METIVFRVFAEAPLAFPTRKPGTQFRSSLPYVPGAALFGALGQALQRQGRFDLALLRAVRCHNAYPARGDDQWVRPLPATALKRKGGHELPEDSLYERVCWEQQAPHALIYAPTDSSGRAWFTGEGFYARSGVGANAERSVTQRAITRVGINRRRGTAEEQRLYSFLALSEVTDQAQTQFLGSLSCPAAYAEHIRGALPEISHLGGRQTTGIGAVRLEPVPDELPATPLEQRVAAMTGRFTAVGSLYQELGGTPWPQGGSLFTVNLLSDAILHEQGWLPTSFLSAQQLKERTGIEAELVRAFATPGITGGWQVVWQRPKPTELSVVMGGLYLFRTASPLTPEAYQRLRDLEQDGIGERRTEGYGQVRICDEFHLSAPTTENYV